MTADTRIHDWDNYSAGLRDRGKELAALHPEFMKGFGSLNRGAASIWLLFLPSASFAPLHSISATADPRGHIMRSTFTGSVCSAHMCASPPMTRC